MHMPTKPVTASDRAQWIALITASRNHYRATGNNVGPVEFHYNEVLRSLDVQTVHQTLYHTTHLIECLYAMGHISKEDMGAVVSVFDDLCSVTGKTGKLNQSCRRAGDLYRQKSVELDYPGVHNTV